LETILATWMNAFQVEGSKNYVPRVSDQSFKAKKTITQIYKNMGLPITNDASKLSVRFNYLPMFWPIYFDVNSDGELIKPDSMTSDLLPIPIGMQDYNTVYDISYPVMVEVRSEPTLDFNDGFAFVFALESNLRHNEPYKCGSQLIQILDENRVGDTLMCNPNQRTTGNVTITLVDTVTGEPVDGIDVLQDIAGNSCILGKTINGKLSTQIAPGYGQFISIVSPDYLKKAVPIDIDESEELDLGTITIDPIITVNLVIRNLRLNPLRQPTSKATKLSKSDEVVIMMDRIKKSAFEDDFNVMVSVKGTDTESVELRVVPGEYRISSQLLVGRSTYIPAERRKAGPWFSRKSYTIPEIDLPNPHPWGGLELDQVRISAGVLEDGELRMTVVEFAEPSSIDELSNLNELAQVSNTLKIFLLPK